MKMFIRYLRHIRRFADKIPLQRLILILSLIVGILSGLSAVLLKNMVYLVSRLLTKSVDIHSVNFLYFVYPFLGLVFTYFFVRYILKEKKLLGITRILYAISKKKVNLRYRIRILLL